MRNTRSRSCGRLPHGEQQLADTNSTTMELRASAHKSRERVTLPSQQSSTDTLIVSSTPEPKNFIQDDVPVEIVTLTDNSESADATLLEVRSSKSVELTDTERGTKGEVGDIRGSMPTDGIPPTQAPRQILPPVPPPPKQDPPPPLPPSKPEDPWHLTFQELAFIRERVKTLDNIERSTEKHTQQLEGVVRRTVDLESAVEAATARIRELNDEVSTLKSVVAKQDKAITSLSNLKEEFSSKFLSLQAMKEDFSKGSASLNDLKEEFTKNSTNNISEMNDLIQQQRDQVASFNDITKNFKQEVKKDIESSEKKLSKEIRYNSLKYQASSNKLNLVITGLKEDDSKAPLALAKNFFTSTLGIKDLSMDVAYRLGTAPAEGSGYIRPLVVRFPNMADKDKAWKNKKDVTDEDGTTIRVHADLPKRLRDDSQLLRRVARAASNLPKYRSAKVKDYKLCLNGEEYAPDELEKLPEPIRPSTLATPRSDSAVVFFSRHSVFSNHYQSHFRIKGIKFNNMEQYLAYRRAQISDKDYLVSKALDAEDPAEAKSILNTLKKDHADDWKKLAPEIAAEGLRAKFKQNQYLLESLLSTRGLLIGEASRDSTWGIGMPLTDPQVLDHTKWPKKGNLLGRSLMKIRDEIAANSSPRPSPSKPKKKQNEKK